MLVKKYLEIADNKKRMFHETFELFQSITNNDDEIWQILGLEELNLLLKINSITDIFLNEINQKILIKRYQSPIEESDYYYTKTLRDSIINRVEYDSGKSLTPLSHTIKYGLNTIHGQLRLEIQGPPLVANKVYISIRRLPKTVLSLNELIQSDQLSELHAKLLESSLQEQKNIIIAGPPGSGKTTLANALLLKISHSKRLITIEDSPEIQLHQNPNWLQFIVPAVGDVYSNFNRSQELTKLLHRSPDFVFLGELQTKEDTINTFESFFSGINGMATTHANNLESLLKRWQNNHQLNGDLISSINLIVICNKLEQNLQVTDIYFTKFVNNNLEFIRA
jgi:pilus assembly protein CpaF